MEIGVGLVGFDKEDTYLLYIGNSIDIINEIKNNNHNNLRLFFRAKSNKKDLWELVEDFNSHSNIKLLRTDSWSGGRVYRNVYHMKNKSRRTMLETFLLRYFRKSK